MKSSEEKNESKAYDRVERRAGLEKSEMSHIRPNAHPNPIAHKVKQGANNHPLRKK